MDNIRETILPEQQSTLGLLTTVANLPQHLKSQYSNRISTSDRPLDLTIRNLPYQITPPCTPSPPKKRYRFETVEDNLNPFTIVDNEISVSNKGSEEVTPNKPINRQSYQRSNKQHKSNKKESRHKATRKLKFDEITSSPVSGTIIRRLDELEVDDKIGDIDPEYNIVEVTEEAKAEIASLVDIIGSCVCRLCEKYFHDVFELAQHRCPCIVLLEYRCPECGKRFNCPANLASHRRWHKPKDQQFSKISSVGKVKEEKYTCSTCNKEFKRLAYLKKHELVHKNVVEDCSSYSNDTILSQADAVNDIKETKLQTFTQIVFRYTESVLDDQSSSSTFSDHRHFSDKPFTEDDNMAAAALALLKKGPSVIRHTTLSV